VGPEPTQGRLFELPRSERQHRRRYQHVHTAEEVAAFERSLAITAAIRPSYLAPDERICPGGCQKIIRGNARSCGRRWCDAVRPTWGRAMADVLQKALDAYCDL
jgi:hypothetical protein